MKIKNANFTKIKKPLSEKDKVEKKRRIKHIFKIVLDVIVYAFAGFMLIGLIFGSTQYKKTDASFYSDNYTAINDVPTTYDADVRLYYYYDVNYKETMPNRATLIDAQVTSYQSVNLSRVYKIDNVEYNQLYTTGSYLGLTNGSNNLIIVNLGLTNSGTTIPRPDIVVSLFGGSYGISVRNGDNFYRWLVYYLSNKGYSRVNYSMPLNPVSYNYLLKSSLNGDDTRFGGYIFRNERIYDDFDDASSDTGVSHSITMFYGSFRSNGVLYSSIEFVFDSVYGNYTDSANLSRPFYYFLSDYGAASIDNAIADSTNDFYKGWYYLSRIRYKNSDLTTTVWTVGEWYRSVKCDVNLNGSWVGDSETSVSPYRDLYILWANDWTNQSNPSYAYFDAIITSSIASYMSIIGDGYVSQIPGGQQDDNSGYFTNVFSWFAMALTGLLPLLGYSLVPGITIATIVMIPISVTIILFVVKLFKR